MFLGEWMNVLDAGSTVRQRLLNQFTQEGAQQTADGVPSYYDQWDNSSFLSPLDSFGVCSVPFVLGETIRSSALIAIDSAEETPKLTSWGLEVPGSLEWGSLTHPSTGAYLKNNRRSDATHGVHMCRAEDDHELEGYVGYTIEFENGCMTAEQINIQTEIIVLRATNCLERPTYMKVRIV